MWFETANVQNLSIASTTVEILMWFETQAQKEKQSYLQQ